MLTISSISKSFGGRLLFQEASLQVNRGDRIGLVGANGAGKSTLFSIILGEDSPDEGRLSMEAPSLAGLNAQSIAGFTTFGSVTAAGGLYTLTEQANAGLTKSVTIPIGAQAVRFRFKFSAPGDGDFLSVRFGDDHPIYTGLDTVLSRDGFTEVEASVDGLDGQTAALTFALISRGAVNAQVQLQDICFIVSDDPDSDGSLWRGLGRNSMPKRSMS